LHALRGINSHHCGQVFRPRVVLWEDVRVYFFKIGRERHNRGACDKQYGESAHSQVFSDSVYTGNAIFAFIPATGNNLFHIQNFMLVLFDFFLCKNTKRNHFSCKCFVHLRRNLK
jgi:hypothetical protein